MDICKRQINLGDRIIENSKAQADIYKREVNLGDRMVTYEMLFEFLMSNELLNDIQDINSNDVPYNLFEQFCILASNFSNDEGSNLFAYGAVHEVTGEAPDKIIEKNIQNTALDLSRIEVGRAKKAPEWSPGYLQKAFIDADLYQQRPIPLTHKKGTFRQKYLKQLAMLKHTATYSVVIHHQ